MSRELRSRVGCPVYAGRSASTHDKKGFFGEGACPQRRNLAENPLDIDSVSVCIACEFWSHVPYSLASRAARLQRSVAGDEAYLSKVENAAKARQGKKNKRDKKWRGVVKRARTVDAWQVSAAVAAAGGLQVRSRAFFLVCLLGPRAACYCPDARRSPGIRADARTRTRRRSTWRQARSAPGHSQVRSARTCSARRRSCSFVCTARTTEAGTSLRLSCSHALVCAAQIREPSRELKSASLPRVPTL